MVIFKMGPDTGNGGKIEVSQRDFIGVLDLTN